MISNFTSIYSFSFNLHKFQIRNFIIKNMPSITRKLADNFGLSNIKIKFLVLIPINLFTRLYIDLFEARKLMKLKKLREIKFFQSIIPIYRIVHTYILPSIRSVMFPFAELWTPYTTSFRSYRPLNPIYRLPCIPYPPWIFETFTE